MKVLHESGVVRVRQCRHGAMAYLTSDQHVGRALDLYGEWAQAELELLGLFLQPGNVALDIGANIGTHATFFAQHVGANGVVVAFEPQRVVHELLCTNAALNSLWNLRAVHAAVGAAPSSIVVPDVDYASVGNFGGVSLGAWTQGETVPVVTVDGLRLPRCDLMKIDVEGMELAVLEGARATLGEYRPVLYLENNGPSGAPEVVTMLTSLGYVLCWHFSPFYRADNFAGVAENVFGPVVDANMLAIPARLARLVESFLPVTGPGDTAAKALHRRGT